MAIMQSGIIRQERRQCMVRMADKTEKKALWHMFSHRATFGGRIGYAYPVAIVEYEDGSVHEVGATEIRFIDSNHEEYYWEDEINHERQNNDDV